MQRQKVSRALTFVIVASALGLALRAHAQTPADVEKAYLNADFQGALRLAKEIEAHGSLPREGYIELLESKLLAQAALQDAAAVDETLRALIALDRTHAFGPSTPPDLHARFVSLRAQAVGEPAISVIARPDGPDVVVSADLVGDAAGLLRHFELAVGRQSPFEKVSRWPERLVGKSSENLVLRVRAVGPAKVTITEAEKHYKSTANPVDAALRAEPVSSDEGADEDDSLTWWLIGAAAVVAIAGATTAAIVLTQDADTVVGAPMFRSP